MLTENIKSRFCEITHLTESEAENYSYMILSAKAYFNRLLKREPTEEEIPICEYAAACKAFFDYATLCAASEKTYSTQTGGIFAKTALSDTVKNAEKLWHNALASLPEDLARDGCFMFEGVSS